MDVEKTAKRAYTPETPLMDFLVRCDVSNANDLSRIASLDNAETLALIDWWKKKQPHQKYTVQVFPSKLGYLNVRRDDGQIFVHDDEVLHNCKTHFTKLEIEQLKQRDDLPINWNKVKIEPVEEDE